MFDPRSYAIDFALIPVLCTPTLDVLLHKIVTLSIAYYCYGVIIWYSPLTTLTLYLLLVLLIGIIALNLEYSNCRQEFTVSKSFGISKIVLAIFPRD